MKKETKKEWRVVFWHNDFADGSRVHDYYGQGGTIYRQVLKRISNDLDLKWHFHGGYITPERLNLIRRLKQADVLIAAYPWNMDMNNVDMHWLEAERSLLDILTDIKKKNANLKVFFLHEPHHLTEAVQELGQIVEIHDEAIYDYFQKHNFPPAT
jgi:hypothetical protein